MKISGYFDRKTLCFYPDEVFRQKFCHEDQVSLWQGQKRFVKHEIDSP